ncbi:MAG: CoA transferase [Parasphingorhabdus sp.]
MSCATSLPKFRTAPEVAEQLLDTLGVSAEVQGTADHPALAWRRSGLLPLCGEPDGEPLMPPLPLAASVDGALMALKALVEDPTKLPANGSLLLGERSRLMGLRRAGKSSTGGHCRLLETLDGRIAINLARDEDWDLIEPWLGRTATSWESLADIVARKPVDALLQQGIELGLPVAQDALGVNEPWIDEHSIGTSAHKHDKPLVVDLSGLWAGPLAGSLLQLAGAEVIKVESTNRPDGARRGDIGFFNLLNAGKKSVMLDFATRQGRADLKKLVSAADIVIEASRPRALRQLGIIAEQLVSKKPGKIWVRLMAYGGDENRIGFGDDIGVSAGLCKVMEQSWGKPCFVADAIADPVAGIYGAIAAWAKWKQGGGSLINLSMVDIVRQAAQIGDASTDYVRRAEKWQGLAVADTADLYKMRTSSSEAEPSGASTASVMDALC